MRAINHLGIWPEWLIPTHQNSKPLFVSQNTTVTHFLFYKQHINDKKHSRIAPPVYKRVDDTLFESY